MYVMQDIQQSISDCIGCKLLRAQMANVRSLQCKELYMVRSDALEFCFDILRARKYIKIVFIPCKLDEMQAST